MSTRLPRRRVIIAAAAIVLAAAALIWTLVMGQRQGAQIDALYAALGDEQSNAEAQGVDPVAPVPEDLIDDPDYTGPAGPSGPPGPGPSDTQVYAAVSAYFTAHPVQDGEDASPAAIAAAVGNYLAENPPEQGEPGPPPTGDQVAAAVETYLIRNPPPAGPPGKDGEDGEDASPETIAAEVAAYMETHPIEYCPEGYSLVAHTVLTTDGPTDQIDCVADEPKEN